MALWRAAHRARVACNLNTAETERLRLHCLGTQVGVAGDSDGRKLLWLLMPYLLVQRAE
jgi:hypothetical protein